MKKGDLPFRRDLGSKSFHISLPIPHLSKKVKAPPPEHQGHPANPPSSPDFVAGARENYEVELLRAAHPSLPKDLCDPYDPYGLQPKAAQPPALPKS